MSSANRHDKFLENTFIFQEHLRRGVKWVLIQKGGHVRKVGVEGESER